MKLDNVSKKLTRAMQTPKGKTSAYDVQGTVARVEEDIAWVRFAGSEIETPVKLTIAADKGDTVQVRVGNGTAWLTGNGSSPPTDDRTANVAYKTALHAGKTANTARNEAAEAYGYAGIAKAYAEEAKSTTDEINAYAETAGKTVTQILNDGETAGTAAQEAKKDAADAKNAADYATYSLSLLEDIVGTLNWISQHGVYVVSTDTTVVPNKTYYTLAGTAITSPTGNPSENAYYELAGNVYVLSSDTVVDTSKTYYQVTATAVIDPTGDPSTNPYYELQIDEAITQYINTHLSLTDAGLRVTDGSQASVLINSTDGVSIWNGNKQLAQYGEGAIIGDKNDYHIEIVNNRLSFKNGNNEEIAYMTNNELYIPRVVVVDSMQIGAWIWDAISTEYHLTLKWKGVN